MDKIAIVGLACLFPDASNPEQYWQNLIAQKDARSQATAEQMGVDPNIFYTPNKGVTDKYYSIRGSYIRDFQFNPTGYQLTPDFLQSLDTLFQWPLHVAREALLDSGYWGDTSLLQRCGVVLGNLSFPTQTSQRLFAPIYHEAIGEAVRELLGAPQLKLGTTEDNHDLTPHNMMISGYPAAVIAQALGLGGANFALDAACASSLYAVKLAGQYLLSGKADLMLAGAVSRADPFFINMGFSIFHAYPETRGSQPLNQVSGGLVAGEGAGIFVLKRHSDAVRDGDKIHAVISGVGLSNDGKGKFLLQPNPKGQILAFERAYTQAGISPADVDYVECHATGTPVGDTTEINSMDSFFGQYGAKPLIGSVKSNFGHLLTAAGMVGMTKVILGMGARTIPATINVDQPVASKNGVIAGEQIVRETIPWPQQGDTERAGVSAFGFGGTNAHLILEKEAATVDPTPPPASAQMAIIGMDAIFGDCDGLAALNETIYHGKQHFKPVPKGRWQGVENNQELLAAYGFDNGAPEGAYITDFDIDFLHFKIPPNNDQPIPQQLLVLSVADRAVQDAGLEPGGNVAVIIAMGTELSLHRFRGRCDLIWELPQSLAQCGITLTPEQEAELEAISKNSIHEPAEVNQYTSFIGNIMASRIASQWDFSGPAFTLSAEENSVFKALEVAEMFLAAGEVDAVVVGAVDLAGGLENVLLRHQMAPVNSGQPTMSYDEQADGWLVGEGAGVVVLKRGEQAVADGDRIYAMIDGVKVHQGAGPGPQAAEVETTLKAALSLAEVTPADIGYMELFGSGIREQDQAEAAGVTAVYRRNSDLPTCALGSVKANIGHTYVAAGIASLIKTALCLHHRYIPPTPGWQGPKAGLATWNETPFYVADTARPWLLDKGQSKRRAAINGLGSDQAYAHLLLSEPETVPMVTSDHFAHTGLVLIPIAGDNEEQLTAQLSDLLTDLKSTTSLPQLARQWFDRYQTKATAQLTVALVEETAESLRQQVELALKGVPNSVAAGKPWKTPSGSYFNPTPLGRDSKVAFVYPGAFSAYPGLGQSLLAHFPEQYPEFIETLPEASELIGHSKLYPRTLRRWSKEESSEYGRAFADDSINLMQAGATYATLMTRILNNSFKLKPDAAMGYSLGEMTMMFGMGVWSVTDNNSTELKASPLFRERVSGVKNAVRDYWNLPPASATEPDDIWGLFVLKMAPEKVAEAVATEERVFLTHINTLGEVIIAGEPAACQALIERLNCRRSMRLPYNHVIHCPPMKAEHGTFKALNTIPVTAQIPDVDFYFAADGKRRQLTSEGIAESIATGTCQMLDFPALVQQAYSDGVRAFVEVGPRSACRWWIHDILKGQPHVAVNADRRGQDDKTTLVQMMAQLVTERIPVDLSPLYVTAVPEPVKKLSLVRTVNLVETPIRESILTAENKAMFAGVTAAVPAAVGTMVPAMPVPPAPVMAMEEMKEPLLLGSAAATPTPPPAYQFVQSRGGGVPPAPRYEERNEEKRFMDEQTTIPATPAPANGNGTATVADDNGLLQRQLEKLNENLLRGHEVHMAFLEAQQATMRKLEDLVQAQMGGGAAPARMPVKQIPQYNQPEEVIWDYDDLLEFAEGKIAPVFGEEYAIIDQYSRRVRLPTPPYLLVTRVTKMEAERGVFEPSTMTTEYDIPFNSWYTTDGQIPWAVAVESGQCDLLLISYLGIDFQNKGERVYRLLDCTLTFLDDIPLEGQTLRYDISINSFARSGDSLLFFFSYNCFVGDKMVLKMRGGCAGFFTDEELAGGKGIITSAKEKEAKALIEKQRFEPLLQCHKRQFTREELLPLIHGDVAAVFGPAYEQNGLNPSLHLPPEGILMIDGIGKVDPYGGAWGLGMIESVKILEPEHWYFPCHFSDDQVMAGSLVAEGCSQLLQFYLMYLGFQTLTRDARFQPMPDLPQVVRTRKQITACSSKLIYRLEITELGLEPKPYAKANVDIIFEGRVVVDFKNLGLQLVEKSPDDPYYRADLAGVTAENVTVLPEETASQITDVTSDSARTVRVSQATQTSQTGQVTSDSARTVRATQATQASQTGQVTSDSARSAPQPPVATAQYKPSPALYDDHHIKHFATGSITACFGEDYRIFEGERIPRTPNNELQLFNRVVEINAERLVFTGKPNLVTEYDVPVNPWFGEQNSYPTVMPYSVLMEVALQPCGFLSAYVGSTLPYPDEDFYFRNLDGDGHLTRNIDLRGKTIRNHVTLLSSTAVKGVIIQKFTYALSCDGEEFYTGMAVFGYFQGASLVNQVGLDQGKNVLPWWQETGADTKTIRLADPASKRLYQNDSKKFYHLAGNQLEFLDEAKVVAGGGKHGKGYVYASKKINPNDWFFSCHFYQDPVMPGSLGVEAIIEAMQIYALDQGLGDHLQQPYFTHAEDHKVVWMYRGQIVPTDVDMYLDVHIKEVIRDGNGVTIIGDANLWKTNIRIYQVTDIAMRIEEAA
ncbi:MAG TPA: PfaB family protein [Anaerolineae bacterium]|nr:PfaB family protein [Anaerolineae bacterium]